LKRHREQWNTRSTKGTRCVLVPFVLLVFLFRFYCGKLNDGFARSGLLFVRELEFVNGSDVLFLRSLSWARMLLDGVGADSTFVPLFLWIAIVRLRFNSASLRTGLVGISPGRTSVLNPPSRTTSRSVIAMFSTVT